MITLDAAQASARRSAMIGSVLAVAGASAYGINIVFARICAQLGLTGADMIAYRSLLLLPLLGVLVLVAGKSLKVAPGERPVLLRFAASAAATGLCYLTSLQYLTVPLAVTIFYTYPLIVMLATPFLDRVRLPARRWVVAGIAFTGVVMAVGPAHASLDWRGVFFAGLGSLFCAAVFLNGARLSSDSMVTFFWCQALAAPTAVLFAVLNGGLATPAFVATALLPFAVTTSCFCLGFLLQIRAGMRISAATAGLLFLLEPVSAIAGAALLLGETLTLVQSAGIALVIAGLVYDLLPALKPAAPVAP